MHWNRCTEEKSTQLKDIAIIPLFSYKYVLAMPVKLLHILHLSKDKEIIIARVIKEKGKVEKKKWKHINMPECK